MMPDSVRPPTTPARRSPGIYRIMILLLGTFVVLLGLYRITQESSRPPITPDEFSAQQAAHPARIAVVPPFALTERNGRQITNRDLNGKIWVADFIYTTCPGPCPLVTANMALLQKKVANDPRVQLVTFTVDPTTDTPDVLANYAKQYKADPDRWWFLTGPEKPMYALIQNGFLQAVQDNRGEKPEPGQFTVTHSTEMAVVDPEGVVRGYVHGDKPEYIPEIVDLIRTLEKEAGL